MTADDGPSDAGESPLIVLRVVIRSPDVDTFVQKYSRFLKDDRIFIFTKASQPPGTRVRFTLELADGPSLIHGEGVVTRIRADQGDPSKPPGMELRFEPIDEASRAMVERMAQARLVGLPPSQPIAVGAPAPPPSPLDDASTKIRTGQDAMPVHTPSAGTPLPPPPVVPRGQDGVERTDVDAGADADKFRNLPPAFTTTPTPLPAPLPLPTIMTPPHGVPAGLTGSSPALDLSAPKGELPVAISRPELPPLQPTPMFGVPAVPGNGTSERDDGVAFALADGAQAPRFAESYVGPLPPPPGAPPPANGGTVPANPFAEVSDQAIEYFVAWSLEQSTAAKPAASAKFANVPMKPPKMERPPGAGMRLTIGVVIGLGLGIPLGAIGMWTFRPNAPAPEWVGGFVPQLTRAHAPAPSTKAPEAKPAEPALASRKPSEPARAPAVEAEPTRTKPADAEHAHAAGHEATLPKKPATAVAQAPASPPVPPKENAPKETAPAKEAASPAKETASAKPASTKEASSPTKEASAAPAPPTSASAPTTPAAAPAAEEHASPESNELPVPPSLSSPHHKTATLRIRSTPPGADVSVKGEPKGPAPVDVELPPNHRYEILVTTPGKPPWKKRINLKPPLTEVMVTFH